MSTVLTGSGATDPTTSPTATAPADTDIGNAASVNGAFQSLLNAVAWLRNNGVFKSLVNVFSAAQQFTGGITVSAAGTTYAVDVTAAPSAYGAVHAVGVGGGFGLNGVGGSANGIGVLGQGGGDAPGVAGNGSGSRPGVSGVGGGTGCGGEFTGNSNRGAIRMLPQPGPAAPVDGDMWVETVTNTLKVRINGVTKTVTLT